MIHGLSMQLSMFPPFVKVHARLFFFSFEIALQYMFPIRDMPRVPLAFCYVYIKVTFFFFSSLVYVVCSLFLYYELTCVSVE